MTNVPLYIRFRGQVRGPYKPEQIREMVRTGQVTDLHEISADSVNWIPLGQQRIAEREAQRLQSQLDAQREAAARQEQERQARAGSTPTPPPSIPHAEAAATTPTTRSRASWILPVSITAACLALLVVGTAAILYSGWSPARTPEPAPLTVTQAPPQTPAAQNPPPPTQPTPNAPSSTPPQAPPPAPPAPVGDRFDSHVGMVVTQVQLRVSTVKEPIQSVEFWHGLGHGTGFVVSDDGYMLTNRHVIRDPELKMGVQYKTEDGSRLIEILDYRHFVRFADGEWRKAKVEYCSETRDVAILRLNESPKFPQPFQIAANVARGERVVVYGFSGLASRYAKILSPEATREAEARASLGSDDIQEYLNDKYPARSYGISQTDGTVSRVVHTEQGDLVQMTAVIHGGNSGGPVLDASGRVIAIVTETFGDKSDKISGAYGLGEMIDGLRRMSSSFARRIQVVGEPGASNK